MVNTFGKKNLNVYDKHKIERTMCTFTETYNRCPPKPKYVCIFSSFVSGPFSSAHYRCRKTNFFGSFKPHRSAIVVK